MKLTPEFVGTDITLVGGFRPANFSGHWLAERGLVRKSDVDADNSEEQKIRNDLYQIKSGAFDLLVMQDRMTVQGSAGNAPVIRDLVLGLLQINAASAISAIGLNFNAHYKCDSEDEWHKIGHFLVPKPMWQELFPGRHIGTRTVQVSVADEGDIANRAEITIQPSAKLKHGIFFGWNDHHALDTSITDPEVGIAWAMDLITERYDRLCSETYRIFVEALAYATR